MTNKKYEKPTMKVLEVNRPELLSGSDNSYWKEPEEKEGCETPWWCP